MKTQFFYLGFCRSINFTSHIARLLTPVTKKLNQLGVKFFSEYSPIDCGDRKERFRPQSISQAMTLSRSLESLENKKKNFRNFTPNELKIAYNGKKSKIIKLRFMSEGFSPKCLFRPENWFFKVFSKKIIKFRSKIAKSVINENNSYHEYPKNLGYSPLTLFLTKHSINIDTQLLK